MTSVCHSVLEEALGRPVSASEAEALFSRFRRRADALRRSDPALGYNDAVARVAQEFTEAADAEAVIARRTAVINATRRLEAVDYLSATWADDPGQGLKALLVGTQDARAGARGSIGADADAMTSQITGGLIADVAKVEGGLAAFSRGDLDEELSGVLWALSEQTPDLTPYSKMAADVGKAIRKWQEYSRVSANEAGAWIGKARGYITSTFHDSARIAKSEGAWLESARSNFDLQRMADEMNLEVAEMPKVLSGIWQNLADGVHLKMAQPSERPAKGAKGIGRKLSQERVIHFKDAAAWRAYNADFGAGNLREAVMWGLRRQARGTAMMNTLGPNYEANYDQIVSQSLQKMKERKAKPADISRFQQDARSYKRLYLSELDGSLDIPANDTFATVAGSIRSIQSMASLGSSTLSSVSDLGVMALGAKYNGLNPMKVMSRGLGELFRGVPSAERLELQADLGLVLTSLSGKLATGRFTPEDDVRGMMGSLQQKFFTLNLQNKWTDSMREAVAELLSANLARRASDLFSSLPGRLRTTLSLYGIDEGKWDIFRKTEAAQLEDSRFLSPSKIAELPDEAFAPYLAQRNLKATPGRIADLKREMQRQFRAYFNDQNSYMLLTPDAGTLGMMKQGTQKGTGVGEAVRFIMQFKSFPLAYTQRVIGREIKQGGMMGVASMIALTSVFGYAAMSLKDLTKGKVPRDPLDYRSWVAALQQGGGAGIYGDVLFSQVLDRRFGDAAAQLLGPTFSDIFGSGGLAGIAARAAQGQDAGSAAVRWVQGNTPFLNLFYTKIALDYLVFYRLQEWMNPGSLDRMEDQMQQRTGQQFIAPPSQTVN